MAKISSMTSLTAADAADDDYFPIVDRSLVAGSPGLANKRMELSEAKTKLVTLSVTTVDPTTEGVNGQFNLNAANGKLFGPKTGGSWGTWIYDLTGESWFARKQTVSIVTGVVAVDYSLGRLIDVPVVSNISQFTYTNWPADGTAGSLTYRFSIGSAAAFTIAFASMGTDVRAEGGVAPAVPSTLSSTLVVTQYSSDNRGTVDLFVGASDMKSI